MILGLLLLQACGTGPESDDGGPGDARGRDGGVPVAMTWAQVNTELVQGCAFSRCHAVGNPAGMFALGTADDYRVLVGAASSEVPSLALIEPGAPQASYLYRKLEGTQAAACADVGQIEMLCGEPMPRGRAPLPAQTREALRLWIEAGARR